LREPEARPHPGEQPDDEICERVAGEQPDRRAAQRRAVQRDGQNSDGEGRGLGVGTEPQKEQIAGRAVPLAGADRVEPVGLNGDDLSAVRDGRSR
jgi:hypothetical protein